MFSSGNFEKSSCSSALFLHSDSHFNPPSQIKRTFAVPEGVQTHPLHPPPAYSPANRGAPKVS